MALPLIPILLGGLATIAGTAGVGTGVAGAIKMKDANERKEMITQRHDANILLFETTSNETNITMDNLGCYELEILNSFSYFSNTIELIQNRPEFGSINKDGVMLPKYDKEQLKTVSVGAGVLLGGLGGAAVGTAGGFAAAGATTAAVMALGTASTGTAIASLSGIAATNATLAALGGGALAAGGGGMALGSTMLGVSTLGVGLLVGGVIFNITGNKISDSVDEAEFQMLEAEATINKTVDHLWDLEEAAIIFHSKLIIVKEKYDECFKILSNAVNTNGKRDWTKFTYEEKLATQNTELLVDVLYKMCKVKLVEQSADIDEVSTINKSGIDEAIKVASNVLVGIA